MSESVIPANWPRDRVSGLPAGPAIRLPHDADYLTCRRRLSDAIASLPRPRGGWSRRDRVLVDAIERLCVMFAPADDPASSGWWAIDGALGTVVRVIEMDENQATEKEETL
jgi:hypothetical protein